MEGRLDGVELFIFIYNTTAESAYFNYTSSSSELFYCVLRFRLLYMSHRYKIHIFHVSGNIMIEQVSDDISRGNIYEGHIKGRSIFEFIPVNNNALERSSFFGEWLKSWVVENAEILEPVYWFIRCHDLDQDPGINSNTLLPLMCPS